MFNSRFDDLIKSLQMQMAAKGVSDNPVSEVSKLMDINYTLRQVDLQLELCKSTILESLTSHENAIVTLIRLEGEREKISISHNKLSNYADNVRPQMIEIAKIRNNFLILTNDNDENEKQNKRAFEEQNTLRETLSDVNKEREDVLDELGIVDQSIVTLKKELKDITTCIRLEKTENDAFHARLEQQRNDMINRNRKLMDKHEDLLKKLKKSGDYNKSYVKIEKRGDYYG